MPYRAVCLKSKKDSEYCVGFVKGNYYKVQKAENGCLVTGAFQDDKRNSERVTLVKSVEECRKHLQILMKW